MELDVSADGASITRFVAADVPSSCGGMISKSFSGAIPIASNAFASDPTDSIRFEGSFPSRGQAAGTLLQASCAGAPVTWTAATDPAIAPVPDTTAPTLDVRVRRSQLLRRGGGVRARVGSASEPCSVTVGGVASTQGARTRSFRLKGASAQLPQGGSVRLEPKLGPRARGAARRALTAGRRVTVRLTISAADAAGNRSSRSPSVRLRPRR